MSKFLYRMIFFCGVSLSCCLASAHAATVRGLVVHINGAPAYGYTVTIYNPQLGRSAPAVVETNGLYILVSIPEGFHYLEVWVPGYSQPIVFQVQIAEPLTDLPAARVP